MLTKVAQLYSVIFKVALIGLILSSLFLFWNQTTEFYDTPKMIVLIAFVILMLTTQTLKYITDGKMVLTVSPIDLLILLLVIVAVISTFTSESYYVSLLGNAPRVYGSLVSLAVAAIFYYLLVNNLKSESDAKPVIYTLVISAIILSLLAILSYFNVKFLPFTFTQAPNFSPIGASFSLVALLCLVMPFLVVSFKARKAISRGLIISILTLFAVVIVLIGNWSMYIAGGFSIILSAVFVKTSVKDKVLLCVPIIVALVIGALSIISLPGKLGGNVLYQKYQAFPREIQLPFDISWSVSISAFRDHPFWGTGLGSYLFNFTAYKPVIFNSSPYWNVNFDTPYNEYLLVLATLGAVGLIALMVIGFLAISLAASVLRSSESAGELKAAISLSTIVVFILFALHVTTLTSMILSLLVLGLFFALNQHLIRSIYIKLGTIKTSGDDGFTFDVLPVVLIIVMGILAVVSGYYLINFTRADFHHRRAVVAAAANNIEAAYNQLANAERLNPYNDLYRIDLAQVDFNIANAIAIAKGPTESSPSGSLTDDDKTSIRAFLEQSIAASRNATVISPRSANNWIVMGSIYRQISGVAQNAIQFALDAYGRAIDRDPLNPVLRLSVGGVYYSIKSYDMAIQFFTDAIKLKADYPNGYYNLSIALRDKGDLTAAQQVAERLVAVLQKDTKSADYKTATEYLSDLKARIATGSAKENLTPPAVQANSALQEKKLPKVIDLPKPDRISTPEAIQK